MKITMPDELNAQAENGKMEPVHFSETDTSSTRRQYSECRKSLPVFRIRDVLIEKIKLYDTVILLGETGCGKSTQIPQYILEDKINRGGCVVVTQPRRIAAISISHRVSDEMNEECGETVGYKIRFKNHIGLKTKLVYATDGTLLREAIKDKLLSRYSIVILDEAHERTITTDILFGVVQSAQELRRIESNPLKIIVMSAALDVDHFQSYFKNAPVFHIEGRNHVVDIYHTKEDVDDYYFTCLTTVFNIHTEAPAQEDILVFLTGQEEIEKMAKDILSISKSPDCTGPTINVHTLYAAVNPKNQIDVFAPTPSGTRKIIVSTNIAETSITIPGIKYVIDSGKVKKKSYNAVTGVSMLKVDNISKEQALQRAGRAGRESNGYCYRAYSTTQFNDLWKNTEPEILRSNLCATVLTLLAMDKNPQTFSFIDKPDDLGIKRAIEELFELGAITELDEPKLNSCGRNMSFLPLNPKYSKIILSANDFNCGEDALDIIAMLSTDNIFLEPLTFDLNIQEIRKKFFSSTGDHLTLLNIFRNFNKVKLKQEWCSENYLNYRALDFVKHIKTQLVSLLSSVSRIRISSAAPNYDNVRKCLITGLFNNIAYLQSDRSYRTVISKQRTLIHPSSALHNSTPPCVLYTELMETNELYMKNVTIIDPEWLHQYVPEFVRQKLSYFSSENTATL